MIILQRKETCEVVLDYTTIGGENIKYYVRNEKINLLRANIDVHSRRLVSEFPGDGVKFISRIQSHCANKTFDDKSRYDRLYSKLHINEGSHQ